MQKRSELNVIYLMSVRFEIKIEISYHLNWMCVRISNFEHWNQIKWYCIPELTLESEKCMQIRHTVDDRIFSIFFEFTDFLIIVISFWTCCTIDYWHRSHTMWTNNEWRSGLISKAFFHGIAHLLENRSSE